MNSPKLSPQTDFSARWRRGFSQPASAAEVDGGFVAICFRTLIGDFFITTGQIWRGEQYTQAGPHDINQGAGPRRRRQSAGFGASATWSLP